MDHFNANMILKFIYTTPPDTELPLRFKGFVTFMK